MKLLILFTSLLVLLSLPASASDKVRQPLKSTELKLQACDVLINNYANIDLEMCKKMSNFVIETVITEINSTDYTIGIGIELENSQFNCLLFATSDVVTVTGKNGDELKVQSGWKIEEDLRNRDQGCIEI